MKEERMSCPLYLVSHLVHPRHPGEARPMVEGRFHLLWEILFHLFLRPPHARSANIVGEIFFKTLISSAYLERIYFDYGFVLYKTQHCLLVFIILP